jgi:O-antigen/teichoic acid export membrane protein
VKPGRRDFARGVVAMTAGSAAAPALALLATPILSRLYPVEAFGLLALFSAVVSLASSIATLRYEQGVVLPDDDGDAAALVSVSVLASIGVAAALAAAVALAGPAAARALDAPAIAPFLWLIPIVVGANGIWQAHSYWATRSGLYWQLAGAKAAQSAVTLGLQITLGVVWLGVAGVALGVAGLVVGFAAGIAVGTAGLVGWLYLRNRTVLAGGWQRARMREVAVRYRELPVYAVQTNLVNALSAAMLPLLITATFGLAVAGIVALADRLTRPLTLVAGSIWQVGHSRLPKLPAVEQRSLVENIHRAGSLVIAFPLAALAAFSYLAPDVFGEGWENLGSYILPLSIMVYFNCLNNMTSYFAVFERYRAQVVVNLTLVGLRLGALIVGAALFDSLTAIWAYALVSAAFYLCVNAYWGAVLGKGGHFAYNVLRSLAMASALVGIARAAATLGPAAGWVAFGAAAVVYALLVPRVAGFSPMKLLLAKRDVSESP